MRRYLAAIALILSLTVPALAQTVPLGPRFVLPFQTVVDSNGTPIPGALLNFYISGTGTRQNTYSDPLLTVPNSNPVVANAAGVFPNIFLSGNYKIVLTDSSGNPIWTADPVYSGFSGNVVGPAISVVNDIAVFNSVTGTSLADSGISLGSQSVNLFLATPSAAPGAPSFRTIAGADLPFPSATTLGGIESITSLAHNWIAYINTSGVPHQSQPNYTDLAGTVPAINPGTTGLGGLSASDASVNILRNSSLTAWFHGCVSGVCTATTSAATTNWCAEGVFVLPTGASVTCQATATVPTGNPGYYALKITGLTSNTDIKVRFVVESYSASKIAGLATTFQFTFINNSGSSITPALSTKYPTTQDGSVTGGAAWGGSTADLSATNLTACPNGSTCTEAYTLTASTSATAGYEFVVDFGAMASNSDTITIGAGFDARATPGISTGINANPPAPEVTQPSRDIEWCQRFYAGSYANAVAPGTSTSANLVGVGSFVSGTSLTEPTINFPVQMRAVPTIAYWDSAGNASKLSSTSISSASITLTANATNNGDGAEFVGSGSMYFSGFTSATSANYWIQYTADASLWGG